MLCGTAAAQVHESEGFPPIADVIGAHGDQPHINVVERDNDFGLRDYDHLLDRIPPARNLGDGWEIWKTRWSEEDERGYEAFVTAIGRSGCISIDDCLRSDANPYRDLEDDTLWLGDCTDMVYVLRGYYAWKNGLPFSYQDAIAIKGGAKGGTDSRYSLFGNRIVGRTDVIHPEGRPPRDGKALLINIFNIVSTAMLRTHPGEETGIFDDFYSLEISREAIRPGTVAYDIYGHVSIVYDVEDDGRILLISSHPDYTVSRDAYGPNFIRKGPELGGGLKAWRPIELVGARKTAKGTYVGGRITAAKNAELEDYSLEQYYGNEPDETGEWAKGRFVHEGRALPYYEYVRARLRDPGRPIDPVDDIANATDALCGAFRARRTAVNLAVYAGIPAKDAPDKLPENIYGTYGDWERYATPSRDARIKTQAVELRQMAEDYVARHAAGDPLVRYDGDLAAAMLDVYDRGANECRFTYKRSDGTRVRLTMHHAMDRLWDMSFDPFHCPERRWGATGNELATCTDDADKTKWYKAQTYLRNDPDRTYDLRTSFTADQLRSPAKATPEKGGIGKAKAPDADVLGYLEGLAGAHVTTGRDLPVEIIKGSGAVNDRALRPAYRAR
jgi:hypothetical protein